jgi:cell division protease FtsH
MNDNDNKTPTPEEQKSTNPIPNKNPLPNLMPGKNNKNGNVLAILISIIGLILLVTLLPGNGSVDGFVNKEKPKSFSDLATEIRAGNVAKLTLSEDKEKFEAEVFNTLEKTRTKVEKKTFENGVISGQESLQAKLKAAVDDKIKFGTEAGAIDLEEKKPNGLLKFITSDSFLTIVLILSSIAIAIVFLRKIAENNSKAISFGNSRAKLYDEPNAGAKITFADVAGNEEAKQELLEVVDFLKRPADYIKMGAKIPRGVLLIGTPGNGKTMMAKAVAGEADVPFLYVSGSEFVEMFVGVGASRVRDLFKAAKKKAPCVIFIDEIDAVGRKRGQGMGGGNDEREQTLNQFLVEMDGFEGNESVIVLGATNRPDVLDQALLRPGRFDRQVTVTVPDKKEREKILEVHAKNKKMAKDVDLSIIAKRTAGFSGADLMNILNEGAILAVRNKQTEITNDDLREAIEKVMLGPSLRSKVVTEESKKHTAYHEAGHALAATVLPKASKVSKITIVPRGKAAGYTFSAEKENDAMSKTKNEFLSEIVVLFGGYTVEELVFKDVSTGGSNDLAKATEIARAMVTKYGMSRLGLISVSESSLGYNQGRNGATEHGAELGNNIDKEVQEILSICRNICKDVITKYMSKLDVIANHLIENETVEYEEFTEMVGDIKDSYVPQFGY